MDIITHSLFDSEPTVTISYMQATAFEIPN